MTEENVNLNIENGMKEVVIRHGEAEKIVYPIPVVVDGALSNPRTFIEKRGNLHDVTEMHVEINRRRGSIILVIEEHSPYKDEIKGVLTLNKDIAEFGINTSKTYTTVELADFIKMHRFLFEKAQTAMELVTQLRQFKAKVEKEVEKQDDKRGNRRDIYVQTIDSNIPEQFTICMPVFENFPKTSFTVEIYINSNFECSLISPELAELTERLTNELIENEISLIEKLSSNLLILER